jgi:hypothetical protein
MPPSLMHLPCLSVDATDLCVQEMDGDLAPRPIRAGIKGGTVFTELLRPLSNIPAFRRRSSAAQVLPSLPQVFYLPHTCPTICRPLTTSTSRQALCQSTCLANNHNNSQGTTATHQATASTLSRRQNVQSRFPHLEQDCIRAHRASTPGASTTRLPEERPAWICSTT